MTDLKKFTISYLDGLKSAEKGKRYSVYDSMCPQLGLRVTDSGSKSFFVMKKMPGTMKVVRITLGKYPVMTISQARDAAMEATRYISQGINPNDDKRRFREQATLGELYKDFMERYSKKEKKSWKYDEREIVKFYSDWFNRKLSSITKQQIQKRHEDIRSNHGLYQANRCLERLRAMYNKAIEWGWDGLNPTNGIKKYKEIKRDRFLLASEAKAFFASLDVEENTVARNYFYMALFTGARKTNVLEMRWDQIDLKNAIWRIPDTKNGEPVIVPLIPAAVELLKQIPKDSEWVFPNPRSTSGHFEDPKKPWARILERAGITDLRIHDIRRTLGSWQALTGASLPIIGKSLGHKSTEATQIYARLSNDPVRDSMTKAVTELMGQK